MADNVASILNDLIETSKDGEKGFNTAADDTKNPELKTTFRRRAQDCARSAADLQGLVARLGGKPETGGSVAGAVHRGWVNVKAAVSTRDDLAILEECERGEGYHECTRISGIGDSYEGLVGGTREEGGVRCQMPRDAGRGGAKGPGDEAADRGVRSVGSLES